ncbi:hypothetical protein Slala03_42300 [Streptomyces lavendulae subsp. lavendulae]|uniref:hypothetical protein n=1 Tax=Streptomyces lavendulae TaxID=1914 RepID=UPI0024A002A7|nr:hypothetical protein [Streptomyces lavendulae]GLV84541.1 hypothetical protein Slala03_42300 [Streptomyces lavendulae subsp. lavendulae]
MYRRTRRAAITSLLVSSFVCGSAVVLAPAAGAAVPTASCTVTPNADGTAVTISGEGFTAPRKLNDGESTEDLNVDATGHFLLKRFQKNVDYTVLAVNEDQPFVFVNCKRVAATGTTGKTASCTVTPNANGTAVTISGEGFVGPRVLQDGQSTEPLNLDSTGHFQLKRFQKNVDYTVVAVNENQPPTFVNCKRVPSPQNPQATSPARPHRR